MGNRWKTLEEATRADLEKQAKEAYDEFEEKLTEFRSSENFKKYAKALKVKASVLADNVLSSQSGRVKTKFTSRKYDNMVAKIPPAETAMDFFIKDLKAEGKEVT